MAKKAPPKFLQRIEEKVGLTPETLKRITTLCADAKAYEELIAVKEKEISEIKAKVARITEDWLPAMLNEAGVAEIRLDDGRKIKLEDVIRANIKEEDRPAAHEWLRKHDFGSLIKTEVTATFGMGEEKKAAKLYEQIIKKYEGVSKTESVHSSTLRAFVAEQLAKGGTLPMSINYHKMSVATIKEGRKS